MKRLAIAGLSLFVFAGAALAELPAERLAARVVLLSGIEKSLTTLPETLRAQSDPLAATRLPDEKAPAGEAALLAFNPEAAKKHLIEYIAANCDMESLAKILVWLESPVGQRMTAAEDAESGMEYQSGKLKYLMELKNSPPSPDRVVAVRKLVQVSGQLDIVAQFFQATAEKIAIAMIGEKPTPAMESVIHAKLEESWASLEKQFLQQLAATDLYVYREVSDDELSSYIAFLESETGKRYVKVVGNGYGQILGDLVMESKKELIESFQKKASVENEDDDACVENEEDTTAIPAAGE